MKKQITTLLLLLVATISSYAATYYSKATGLQTRLTTSWSSTTDGTGASPANLTTDGDVFIIQNGHAMTTGTATTFSAINSTLNILAGGSLTASHAITVTNFIVDNGGEYIHNAAVVMPAVSGTITLGTSSTVEIKSYLSTATLPAIAWGNLIINVSLGAEWVMNDQPNFETKGNLIIRKTGSVATRVVRLSPNTGTLNVTVTVGGDLLIEGGILTLSASSDAASANNQYLLHIKGNLVVDDKGTANYSGITIAELRVANANAQTAMFSVIVDGNTEIKKGSYVGSNVATNNSANINLDHKGNFVVDADGIAILSKAATVTGTIKAISMIVGGNFEVNGTFTGTAGAPWTNNYGGATVYFKGGAANSNFKMPAGQGATNIAYVIGENKTLTLQSDIVTDKFLAVAGTLVEGGYTVTGTKHVLVSPTVNFNGGIAEITKSVITLPIGETVTSLSLVPGMEVTSSKNYLAPNTVITQIIDPTTITISRAAIGTYSEVLPLTLVNFNAVRETNGIRLQWRTAQEINVKQIEIERSVDGFSFIKIGSLAANNNAGEHDYTYLDRNASTSLYNYYRLKTIDYDGSVDYSKELVAAPLSIVMSEIHLFPNPVNSYVEVNFPVETGKGYVKVLAVDGRIMKQETVSKTQKSLRLDLSSLAKSLYILVYEDGNGKRYTSRFVKN